MREVRDWDFRPQCGGVVDDAVELAICTLDGFVKRRHCLRGDGSKITRHNHRASLGFVFYPVEYRLKFASRAPDENNVAPQQGDRLGQLSTDTITGARD